MPRYYVSICEPVSNNPSESLDMVIVEASNQCDAKIKGLPKLKQLGARFYYEGMSLQQLRIHPIED